MGVHKAIAAPEIMWQHFEDYKAWAEANPVKKHVFVGKDGDSAYQEIQRPLTYEEFCDFLEDNEIIKDPIHYFMNYEGRYEDFVSVCSRIKRVIRGNQIVGGLAGIYNPSITQRLNNLTEKVEAENKHEVKGVQMIFQQSAGCQPLKTDSDAETGS